MVTIYRDIWSMARPYVVSLGAHFIIFCLTMIVLVLMLYISWEVVNFCEVTLRIDPFIVKIFVVASDLFIIVHFILFSIKGLNSH